MARYAIWQSGEAQTFVFCGFKSHPCHSITCVGWALACPSGCNPPASCSAGSTPARRTQISARSSSGSGCWPLTPATRVQIPHGSMTWPSGATGRHATLRTSCPYGLGSSTLPLVTAGGAGARLAFIRPGCPDRYRGLQLRTTIAGGPALSGVS